MMARGVEALEGPTSKTMFCIADESSESSSIGVASPSVSDNDRRGGSDDEDENEAESKPNFGALGSLDSLEESLPIKRGLSKHYTGKSKSFASLSAMPSASSGDIAKTENPVNKRRRIIMAYRSPWLRRESLPSLFIPLPPTTNEEEENDEEEEEVGPMGGGDGGGRKFRVAFRSPRSFSLSDLRRA